MGSILETPYASKLPSICMCVCVSVCLCMLKRSEGGCSKLLFGLGFRV